MVYMDCDSSFGASSAGDMEVLDIDYRYDSVTGERFKILITEGTTWDTRTGDDYDNKSSMFYIV